MAAAPVAVVPETGGRPASSAMIWSALAVVYVVLAIASSLVA